MRHRVLLERQTLKSCLESHRDAACHRAIRKLIDKGHEVFYPANIPPTLREDLTRDAELGGFGMKPEDVDLAYHRMFSQYGKPVVIPESTLQGLQVKHEYEIPGNDDRDRLFFLCKDNSIDIVLTATAESYDFLNADAAAVQGYTPEQVLGESRASESTNKERSGKFVAVGNEAWRLNALQRQLEAEPSKGADSSPERDLDD